MTGKEIAVCKDCRSEFHYWPRYAGNRVRCDDCRTRARRKELAADPQEAACQQCGKGFQYLAWFGEKAPKFCSDPCRKAGRASYMRRYRARVRVDKRRPCQICKKRRVLRWDEDGFTGNGFLCSAHCWVEWWKARLVAGNAYDYDHHIQELLNLRADAKQAKVLEPYLTGDPDGWAWLAEIDLDDDEDLDLPDDNDDLGKARIRKLVELRRSDGTR